MKPPVEDAAQINKESSEVKEAGLDDELTLTGPPQDDGNQAVEEEEKKGDEVPISEAPLQDTKFDSI